MAHYIGLMSGTSMDAIDAVLVDFTDATTELLASHSHAIPTLLQQQLREFIGNSHHDIHTLGELDNTLGNLFADAVLELIAGKYRADDISAIGSHGQTVFHAPAHHLPFTLQIGDPNIIAERTGITTVADFRRRDIAAGGQGAPLVPAFHNAVFRSTDHNRVILNIGGIANITALPAKTSQPVTGFDTGPGNTLLDSWIQKHLDKAMDEDGQWAAGGEVNADLLSQLLTDPYFSAPSPKSTGREYFNLEWLTRFPLNDSPQNIQATLCQLTIETIAQAITEHRQAVDEVFVCGGGAYNKALMQGLSSRLNGIRIKNTAELGIAPEWVEAMAFAWLAKQTVEGKPGNLPDVTGAERPVVLGGIYPV